MEPTVLDERRLMILGDVALVAVALQQDVIALGPETDRHVEHFRSGAIGLEQVCFWHKALGGAFFASADGLCFTLREAVLREALISGPNLTPKVRRSLAAESRLPLEKLAPLALRNFAAIFSAEVLVDTSGESFRGFKALTDAREAFVHPKSRTDVCPFRLFPTLSPASEWFLLAWRSTLVSCSRAIGYPLRDDVAPTARFQFRDEWLGKFERARENWDADRGKESPLTEMGDVLVSLESDTTRALSALRGPDPNTRLSEDCKLRMLLRFLFAEIEGSIQLARALLNSENAGSRPDKSFLVGSHETVRALVVEVVEEFAARFGSNGRVRREGPGWGAFLAARALRNGITHPHSANDLRVGVETRDAVLEVLDWWQREDRPCLRPRP